MTVFEGAVYADSARRAYIRSSPDLNGIDYIEVVTAPEADNQRVLRVFFIPPEDPTSDKLGNMLDELHEDRNAIEIRGGRRVRQIKVVAVQRDDDQLEVRVDQPGDFSDYTLSITHASLDSFYQQVDFNFKAGCPSRFDCKPREICPPEPVAEPFIDYMAKDYASFRQALIDLIPTLVPGWAERHEADLGMTLIDLLAYIGDQLSYYQDAVANEAYLETARQRVSVRRHARLIDYTMHDGLSARAFVHFELAPGAGLTLRGDKPVEGNPGQKQGRIIQLLTRPRSVRLNGGKVIAPELGQQALDAADTVFEIYLKRRQAPDDDTPDALHLHAQLNRIRIHTWGNEECYLPVGATSADLVGDLAYVRDEVDRADAWRLKRGDLLLFEEVKSPVNGNEDDADPNRRQVVRLTEAVGTRDELLGVDVTRVEWNAADALRFPLCVATRLEGGSSVQDVSVARGNLAVADHGRSVSEWHPGDPGAFGSQGIEVGQRAYRFGLQEVPLGFSVPLETKSSAPVQSLLDPDPRRGEPAITLLLEVSRDEAYNVKQKREWQPVTPDLLSSNRFATDVVVETDNMARATLRFGDNAYGMMPPDDAFFEVRYRVGIGTGGNIGADALGYVIRHADVGAMSSITGVRNPLPAWGGIAPESLEQVKRLAPAAFRAEQYRAVTEADYARAAEKHPQVSKAVANFRWTGSWHTVFITVDPKGATELPKELEDSVRDWVLGYTMTGYDLEIDPPVFAPLQIELDICVAPGYFRSDVEQALLDALSSRAQPDGSVGFFFPDNFTFGQRLYLSQLYAAVEGVIGVGSVVVQHFARQYASEPEQETQTNLEQGYIPVGRLEVIRLDNDPSFPENGILRLKMRGGE